MTRVRNYMWTTHKKRPKELKTDSKYSGEKEKGKMSKSIGRKIHSNFHISKKENLKSVGYVKGIYYSLHLDFLPLDIVGGSFFLVILLWQYKC